MTKSINKDKYVTASDVMNLQHNTTLCQNSYVYEKHSRNSCIFSKSIVQSSGYVKMYWATCL